MVLPPTVVLNSRASVMRRPSEPKAREAQVGGRVHALEVGEMPAPLAHQLEKASPRGLVVLVGFEMFGELLDAPGEDRHLDFGRSGVTLVTAVFPHKLRFLFLAHGHDI